MQVYIYICIIKFVSSNKIDEKYEELSFTHNIDQHY